MKHITSENLTFFLEYLGEKATEEEIEEMIKMCDIDGNGEVFIYYIFFFS